MKVSDLIARIDAKDTQRRVKRTVELGNQLVRNALSDELLRFKFAFRGGRAGHHESHLARASIHYEEVGHPELLALEVRREDELALIVSLHLGGIQALRRGADDVAVMLQREGAAVSAVLDLETARGTVAHAASLAAALEEVAGEARFRLVSFLHSVGDDILGCWQYSVGQDQSVLQLEAPSVKSRPFATSMSGDIHIYWGIVGLVAKELAVSIEGLTMVTLAHELAHAYTHLGFDRDGQRWHSEDFARSERALKEGLAQLYTQWLLERFDDPRFGDALEAYRRLMVGQPPEYHAHTEWLNMGITPEAAATALMAVRRRGRPVSHQDFTSELEKTARRTRVK